MAFPLRRNSGPDSDFMRMLKRKSTKKLSDETSIKQVDRNRKTNKSADFLCDNSSSSESLENIISTYKARGKKQSSIDMTVNNFEEKQPMKPKRSSWFLRDRSREKFFKRASLDFTITSSTSFEAKSSARRGSKFQRQNATEYHTTGESSSFEPPAEPPKKSSSSSGLSKFQLGKRLLKGEIGIRSFNYYLLKEGLKKRGSNGKCEVSTAATKARSEENIYEEIYFRHDLPTPKPRITPPDLPPLNKPPKAIGNCTNCEICLQEAAALDQNMTCDKCLESAHVAYARVNRNNSADNLIDYFGRQQQSQPMLTFQSYNPNYPNIYKLETTPLVTPVEYGTIGRDNKIVYQSYKSSTAAAAVMSKSKNNEFYTRPNYMYPSSSSTISTTVISMDKQEAMKANNSTRVNCSSTTNENNEIIYNGSQKSVQSNKSNGSAHDAHYMMSDSSLGDSLFSSDPKRGFGSSESCAANRRDGSLEREKCSFSDTTCNFKNCDCSSSYFSSDFDDKDIYNQTNMKPESYYEQQRANLCNEDASKRQARNPNHHYEVPKKQQKETKSSNHLTTASAQQQKTSSSSTESATRKKRITTKQPHEDVGGEKKILSSPKSTSKQHHQQLRDDKKSSKENVARSEKDNDAVKSSPSAASKHHVEQKSVNDDNFAGLKIASEAEKDKKAIPVS